MKRKVVWLVVSCLMVFLLLSGCGVAQEEHDAVVVERDAAQTQVAFLQSDLAEVESQIETLESELAATQSNLAAKESELAEAEGQISSLKSNLGEMQSQTSSLESDLATAESALAEEEARVAELEAQIAELEVEKADLEAQLEAATEEVAVGFKLLLISKHEDSEYDRVGVSGEVKNISDESLSDVEVVIDIYERYSPDRSVSALIHSNPLLPGKTSSFEVYATVSESGGVLGKGITRMYFKFRDPHIIPHTTE